MEPKVLHRATLKTTDNNNSMSKKQTDKYKGIERTIITKVIKVDELKLK